MDGFITIKNCTFNLNEIKRVYSESYEGGKVRLYIELIRRSESRDLFHYEIGKDISTQEALQIQEFFYDRSLLVI